MKYTIISLFLMLSLCQPTFSQKLSINKIEPPNWWTGLKNPNLQLMVYGNQLSNAKVFSKDLKISKVHSLKNPSYLFIDIDLKSVTRSGDYEIVFIKQNDTVKVLYPISPRENTQGKFQGYSQKDVIYLITPDRFVNGDTKNDNVEGYSDKRNLSSGMGRHGGDLQGIINKLDYIKDLGFTAIWINPIVENNTPFLSYHGYGATDLYKIDPRLGTNELYKQLVEMAHKKGLKIIFDHVNNHISNVHPWMENLPIPEWINLTKENHYITTHNKRTFSDIYAADDTKDSALKGWFVEEMPDLNQSNPFVSNYLTQNMIWWIEYSGLDGIREDTYPYSDALHMANWNKSIMDQYPNFNIVGEIWLEDPAYLSYFQQNNHIPNSFNSKLPSILDFGISKSLQDYLAGTAGITSVYETISKDYLYFNPLNNVTFIDNQDMPRGLFTAKGNIEKFKSALFMLLTIKGIPQVLYATEIAMQGGADHSLIRTDFPGGMPEHSRSAFDEDNRVPFENDFYSFTKNLLKIRNENEAVSSGKFLHFPPEDDVYYYFRSTEKETFLFIVNGSDKSKNIDFKPVKHKLTGSMLLSLENNEKINPAGGLKLSPYQSLILKIVK